ncbi:MULTISPECIES: carbonic anhydrase [unclassified Raineyella]|uniref:beta-class carbonic anhydrase n=1 Tax=unclassified Raineyella TaxID=2662260 RepID=UPI002953F246|nr:MULTISPECIES: carbonic anhydrase [unclassified Raineyella]WOP18065.1 carbonic anhydrase [Raineyella sp. LH-20]WOQ18503.1 carbonic anhydrase [Raineyella sp. W15-4]
MHPADFADLLENNAHYAEAFTDGGFDGIAKAGVLMVTCMDSRITPLQMIGLRLGDAKILRTPGGRVTHDALIGCILGVHLLNVDRIMVVPHSRCAVGSGDDKFLADKVHHATGADISGMVLGSTPDQEAGLRFDVALLRTHPLLVGRDVLVGGFHYDVDSGRLTQRY